VENQKTRHIVKVCAAVIYSNGRILVTRRPPDKFMGNHWEFPGGKCEPGESPHDCIIREIREELAIEVQPVAYLLTTKTQHPNCEIEMEFLLCRLIAGTPKPVQCSECRWATLDQLNELKFPPADSELVKLITQNPSPLHGLTSA